MSILIAFVKISETKEQQYFLINNIEFIQTTNAGCCRWYTIDYLSCETVKLIIQILFFFLPYTIFSSFFNFFWDFIWIKAFNSSFKTILLLFYMPACLIQRSILFLASNLKKLKQKYIKTVSFLLACLITHCLLFSMLLKHSHAFSLLL